MREDNFDNDGNINAFQRLIKEMECQEANLLEFGLLKILEKRRQINGE